VNLVTELPSHGTSESRHASRIWKGSTGGVLLLLGAALTPVWVGLLGWLSYELALAAAGLHG
jgi:hypothetical protein